MTYEITDEQRERLRTAVEIDNPRERVVEITEITTEIGEQNDASDLEALASHVGTHEVVGTGMGMALSEVLDHLSDLAELQDGLDIPTHGGDEDLLEGVSLNERFDHNVYYALQTLYGKLIYDELPEHQKEVVNLR
jgi:hypothetical protein